MQRAVPVAADEGHGQEVEEPAQVALEAVARAAVLARPVVDGKLGDAEAAVVREHGDEAVQLAVQPQAVDDLGAVRLQAAVHVVQADAGERARDAVEDAREEPARERVAPVRLPAGDQVEALVELREQPRDLGGIVLQVAVDRDDGVAACLVEAGHERGGLAEVAAQPDDADVLLGVVESRQRGERAVGRAVVDEDRLPLGVQRLERRAQLVVEQCDAAFLVVNGNDDRDHGSEPSVSCTRIRYSA